MAGRHMEDRHMARIIRNKTLVGVPVEVELFHQLASLSQVSEQKYEKFPFSSLTNTNQKD